jgi:hypothetical protein
MVVDDNVDVAVVIEIGRLRRWLGDASAGTRQHDQQRKNLSPHRHLGPLIS